MNSIHFLGAGKLNRQIELYKEFDGRDRKVSMLSSVKNIQAIHTEKLNAARTAEEQGDLEKAIRLYEDLISLNYRDPYPFNRLMIIYRKEKRYKDELRVINTGINTMTNAIM